MSKSSQGKKILTLILMMLSLNTIYVLPYLMYTYYTPLQEAMGLVGQDAAYGRLLNIYGIANIILYLPGGWIADRFDSKKLLVFSMISTGVLGLWEATWPGYTWLVVIHIGWAFTTVLTYWSSSIKCINVISAADEQGTMFGSLEAGRSVVGLICTTLFVGIYTMFAANSSQAMSGVVLTCSIIMILVGVLMGFLMPRTGVEGTTNKSLVESIKAMGGAFKLPATYLLAGMIFAASMSGATLSYFAPYLQNICGMNGTIVVIFSNYDKVICSLIAAAVAAFMARKMGRSSTFMIYAGVVAIVAYLVLMIMPGSSSFMYPVLAFMVIVSLCYPVFRALYYAVIDECGTHKNMVGSVIGIASLIGFLPDAFYTSLCGSWLEADPVGGYMPIFLTGMLAMLLGTVCAFISDRRILSYRKTDDYKRQLEEEA